MVMRRPMSVAARVADERAAPFGVRCRGPPADPVADNVLAPDEYARILHDLGCVDIDVDLHVYPHMLPTTRHAVEWVKGTTLTRFRSALSGEAYDAFLADYERELVAEMGEHEPCFFPFNRILFVATTREYVNDHTPRSVSADTRVTSLFPADRVSAVATRSAEKCT